MYPGGEASAEAAHGGRSLRSGARPRMSHGSCLSPSSAHRRRGERVPLTPDVTSRGAEGVATHSRVAEVESEEEEAEEEEAEEAWRRRRRRRRS